MIRKILLPATAGLILAACFVSFGASLDSPPASRWVDDRQGRFLTQLGDESQGLGYWPLVELPPRVVAATLALEDRRFQHHPGVDPIAIARAAWQNWSAGRRVSGASTVAMQTARLIDPGPRTYGRKLREALHAIGLTLRYGREAVLGHYLQVIPYGNRSHGIAHAARLYLDKPVADLSWAEIAFLSAIPQAPSLTNPFASTGRARAKKRALRILQALNDAEVVSAAELELAMGQLKRLSVPLRRRRPAQALHAILRLEQELQSAPVGQTRLRSTIDLDLQRKVQDLTAGYLQRLQRHGADNAAAVVMRVDDLSVLAWLGSGDYFAGDRAGAIDYTRVERSPGSTLKPFIYALALDREVIRPDSVLDDLPAGVAGIANADRRFLGPMLPRQALANSRNTPAVRLLKQVGLERTYWRMHGLGLHRGRIPARHYGLGLALGALPTTMERLAVAYGSLANEGLLRAPKWYQGQARAPATRVFSPTSARLVNLFLADGQARLPGFPRMGSTDYPFPVAVKTGTSQGYRDAWTFAYSRRYLVGVWLGRADAQPMRELSGGGSAAFLAKAIMSHLHRSDGTHHAALAFPRPAGHRAVQLCALTGRPETPGCERIVREWLQPESEPRPRSAGFRRVAMDNRSGLSATADTPRHAIAVREFLDLPARYHAWAAANGVPLAPPAYNRRKRELTSEHPETALDEVHLTITHPEDGLVVLRNPEAPVGADTLALRVTAEPPVSQVLWYVDGKPYELAEAPFTLRWPLKSGEHRIEVGLPNRPERSRGVTIRVE